MTMRRMLFVASGSAIAARYRFSPDFRFMAAATITQTIRMGMIASTAQIAQTSRIVLTSGVESRMSSSEAFAGSDKVGRAPLKATVVMLLLFARLGAP